MKREKSGSNSGGLYAEVAEDEEKVEMKEKRLEARTNSRKIFLKRRMCARAREPLSN